MSLPLPDDFRRTSRAHRKALARRLPDGLIVLSAEAPPRRNGDVDYRFRQDSDFLYLTGVLEPGYALVLDPRRGEAKMSLRAFKEDNEKAAYNEYRASVAKASKFGTLGDLLANASKKR